MNKKFIRIIKKIIRYKLDFLLKIKERIIQKIFLLPFINKPFPKKPFGDKPQASADHYLKIHKNALENENKKVIQFEKEIGFSINKEWFHKVSLITQTCVKNSDLNFNHGRILYCLFCRYVEDNIKSKDSNITILETGTARGFSSLCLSKAINDQNIKGKVITLDCIPHNQKMFWNCIEDSKGEKSREELLGHWEKELSNIIFIQGWTTKTLKNLGLNRINFAFLDAQHSKEAVLEEFEFIYERQKINDIIFFDDVTPDLFQGVCEAVKEISKNYPYTIKYLDFDRNRGYALAIRV